MIELITPGHETPEQPREEIAQLLAEYGVGAVCLLRNGGILTVIDMSRRIITLSGDTNIHPNGAIWRVLCGPPSENPSDIIRVYPPGMRLRITVETDDA